MKQLAIVLSLVLVLLLGVCAWMIREQEDATTEPSHTQTQPQYSEPIGESTAPTQPEITEPTVPPTSQPVVTEPSTPIQTEPPRVLEDEDFVRIADWIPSARIELPYATEENFTSVKIYPFTDSYLRFGTVKKLAQAADKLAQLGYGILVWDGYRPVYAQQKLWDVCPDPNYVSKPGTGSQSHCRGIAVDITLYDLNSGKLLEMPSGFDEFSALGDRDYRDCSAAARANAELLEQIMESCGFKPYSGEWWHFTDTNTFEIEYEFDPSTQG